MTPEAFKEICSELPDHVLGVWYPALVDAAKAFDINTTSRLSMWLAQLCHESRCFTQLTENMNYSSKRLAEVWPGRFAANPSAPMKERLPNATAEFIGNRPELIANNIYSNRYGNGAPNTGDGWRYRGHYPCMLTFRSAYEACNVELGIPDIEAPDLLLNDTAGMAMVSGWFVSWKRLNAVADLGNFRQYCTVWNGGDIGFVDRVEWHNKVVKALSTHG